MTAPSPEPGRAGRADTREFIGRAVRYGFAGLFAALVYFAGVYILVEYAALPPVAAAVGATMIVIVTSYIVNRRWVFDTNRSHRSSFSRFFAASLLGFVLNPTLMHLAMSVFGWSYIAGIVLASVVVPPVNFVINYFWAFKPDDSR